jgi:hypothetical protein
VCWRSYKIIYSKGSCDTLAVGSLEELDDLFRAIIPPALLRSDP